MALFAFSNITEDDVHNYHLILKGPVSIYTNESLPIMCYCLTCGDRPTAVGLAGFRLAAVNVP
jgi:hypothetical protein